METILHLLPLTGAQKAAFQAAAPESEHLFLPTNDRGGASSIPQEWRERTTILLGYVPPDQLKTFPNLKWVQSWNAGVDPYLAPGVLPGGVRLTSAVGAYGPAVSEHMLAMLLAIYKRLPAYRDQQRAHIWADLGPVGSLAGKTVLVGGAGDIGRHFARLVRALGAQRVIGLRRSAGCPVEGFDEIYGLGALDGLLPQADVVALALPHTPETAGLMSKARLLAMRPGSTRAVGAPWTAPPWRRCCAPAACWARDWTLPIRNLCPQDTPSGRPPASSSPPTPPGAITTWRPRWSASRLFSWTTCGAMWRAARSAIKCADPP